FLVAVLPPFIEPSAPLLPQYTVIGLTMVAVDLVVMGVYTALASRLMRLLHTARRRAALSRVSSGLFATAALGLSLCAALRPREASVSAPMSSTSDLLHGFSDFSRR